MGNIIKMTDGSNVQAFPVTVTSAVFNDENDSLDTILTGMQNMIGTPLVASTVAGMTDQTKIYVYTGSETGYTAGNWYYYNGSAWTSGGVYNSTAFTTDTTLAVSGMAADAKVTGDEIEELKSEIDGIQYTDYIAQNNGYKRALNYTFDWESGSINYPSGANKNPDANVIRTELPRFQLNGNVSFILLNTKYRIRYYTFPDTTSNATAQSSWLTAVGKMTYTIDNTKYYRIQIATQSGTTMNMAEALSSIIIVYESEKTENNFASFWAEYIRQKAQTINSYLTKGTDKTAFLFLTDTHWIDNNPSYLNSFGINTGLMKYIADNCNIQYAIHGGDINSEYRSDINIARQWMTLPVAKMRDAFEHVLLTRGNHDDNNESGNKNWSYTISQSDSYSYMFRNTKDVVFGATGTYFYHDIPFDKVRIISIDGNDFPYTNNVDATQLDEKLLAYGYDQLQWVCDTLASTPDDYHIIIYTHEMLAPSAVTIDHPNDSPQTRAKNYLVLVNILKAYKNRSNYSETISGSFSTYHSSYYSGTLSKNFTNCDATIVGVFSGHEHIDCIEEILDGNGNGIGIYNTCTQNSSNLFGSGVLSATYQHPMTIGTTTELVWDVVVVDRAQKHVDMIRIGAYAANTDVSAVTVRSFNYT